MTGKEPHCSARNLLLKRLFDIVVSILLIGLLSPLALLIVFVIKIDSRWPVLFRQLRVGKNLQQFKILKFRTMYHVIEGYDGDRVGVVVGTIEESRIKYKTTELNDTRITKVGKYLRKSHIDELPQLFNVLLGSMSLVGPRPDAPAQEYDYKKKYWIARHGVKPGITGLSQVHICRNSIERLARDIYYIEKSNMYIDFLILIKTISKLFKFNSF